MLLKDELSKYTKNELLDHARSIGIVVRSGLRKAELVDSIDEKFCEEEFLRFIMTCMTDEQLELFRRALISPVEIGADERADAVLLSNLWLGGAEMYRDVFHVFDEIAEMFPVIDDDSFAREQSKKGWLCKCLMYAEMFYGVAPLGVIYELYRQRAESSFDEMERILGEIPISVSRTLVLPADYFEEKYIQKGFSIHDSGDVVVSANLFASDVLEKCMDSQADKPFYIPSAQEILDAYKGDVSAGSPEYNRLTQFFLKEMHMSREEADKWTYNTWMNSFYVGKLSELFNKMGDEGVIFGDKEQVSRLAGLVMEAHNSTRMLKNRGHTPNEIRALYAPEDMGLRNISFPGSFGGSSSTGKTRVGRNEPCPCGSGKKYKRCCGLN